MDTLNLLKKLKDTEIVYNADMSRLTTFRCGGKADVIVYPETAEALKEALILLKEKEPMALGGGSNLLVRDEGYHGIMIGTKKLNAITLVDEDTVYAQAGARLSSVCSFAHRNGLTGMEFAGGIPGTVGGGVFMNAGAYGGELKDILLYAEVMDGAGGIKKMTAEELELGYRHSKLMAEGGFVIGAAFRLEHGDIAEGKALLAELNFRRRDKQPTDLPSAGSTFKRPTGYFAGALIEQSGLKGAAIGGAQVSEKHCGFIVNIGGATATDVIRLIDHVKETVAQKQGVVMETEVRIIGGAE